MTARMRTVDRDTLVTVMGREITALTVSGKDPNLRRIMVGRVHLGTLPDRDVNQLGLHVGTILDAELLDRIRALVEHSRARAAAMRLLGRRAYSSGEVVDRLTRKGFDRNIAQPVADELVDDGWIDDRAYAQQVTRELIRGKPAGKRLIISRLMQKRIDRALAEDVAQVALENHDLRASAHTFASRRLKNMQHLDRATIARRLSAALARRGVDDDIVREVVDHALIDNRTRLEQGSDLSEPDPEQTVS